MRFETWRMTASVGFVCSQQGVGQKWSSYRTKDASIPTGLREAD
jgi:hypothetical protein